MDAFRCSGGMCNQSHADDAGRSCSFALRRWAMQHSMAPVRRAYLGTVVVKYHVYNTTSGRYTSRAHNTQLRTGRWSAAKGRER